MSKTTDGFSVDEDAVASSSGDEDAVSFLARSFQSIFLHCGLFLQ